jgi:uncharacterized protein (DUF433 family)
VPLPIVLVPHPHVLVDPRVLGGSPHVAGTRVPVRRLWAFYRSGAGIDTIVKRYPQLGPAKIFDALAFAWDNQEVIEADLAREQALLGDRPARSTGSTAAQMELPLWGAPAAPGSPAAPRRRRSSR